MRSILTAFAIVLATSATAKEGNIKVVSPGGSGSYKIISSSEEHSFTGLTFLVLNGYVHITFQTSIGLMAFAGHEELQPSAEEYILLVDSLETSGPGDDVKAIPAKGKCIVHQTADGMVIRDVACASTTDFGPAVMSYKGAGQRVHITPVKN